MCNRLFLVEDDAPSKTPQDWSDRSRFLMNAQPHSGNSGGALRVHFGPNQFAEVFLHVNEQEATDALGDRDGACVGCEALDTPLDRVKRLLTEEVRRSDDAGA